MNEKLIISSVNQFIDLARKMPPILNVGSFSLLKQLAQSKPSGGCKCNKKPAMDANTYRPQFEAAMAMLSDSDKAQLKTLLNYKMICYYVKNGLGQLHQICF